MTRYWLTPVQWDEDKAIILGAERMALEPAAQAGQWLNGMKHVHPRLLLPFKASLLLSDESDSACGSETLTLHLDSGIPLYLGLEARTEEGGQDLILSHCAEAYIHRLPSVKEALAALDQTTRMVDEKQSPWDKSLREWLQMGYQVILLREDGNG